MNQTVNLIHYKIQSSVYKKERKKREKKEEKKKRKNISFHKFIFY